tara:strand:- start:166 stop:513 length:348 start_codon:yes stop_codon:yes gene_type:complete
MNSSYDSTTSSSSDDDDLHVAQLTIYADADGLIYFACDWKNEPLAIESMADIFYKLDQQDLITEILTDLKEQCVLENKEEIFYQMFNMIKLRIADGKTGEKSDSVAVPPSKVTRI